MKFTKIISDFTNNGKLLLNVHDKVDKVISEKYFNNVKRIRNDLINKKFSRFNIGYYELSYILGFYNIVNIIDDDNFTIGYIKVENGNLIEPFYISSKNLVLECVSMKNYIYISTIFSQFAGGEFTFTVFDREKINFLKFDPII